MERGVGRKPKSDILHDNKKFRYKVKYSMHIKLGRHELIPPCDARRREKVGALYSTVYGLLAVISRAYPPFLSPVSRNLQPLNI